MKANEIKRHINVQVAALSKVTGIEWKVNYQPQYGGYEMYYDSTGKNTPTYGKYGVRYRKTAKEMHAYLEGLLLGLCP